jgi:hypothetical protein
MPRFGSRISDDCSFTKRILGVRNESICYEVFIDRTKPDNCVRVDPAARHSETKYGFIILTGDMIFKNFFVGVKLLLGHELLSSAAANNHQNQLTCHVLKTKRRGGRLAQRSTDEASSSSPSALRISLLAAALLTALV